ncbi:MAG: diacylglycerol kinase family protein [Acholeplasmataceae bacterium]
MTLILYNPLSRNGRNSRHIKKLTKRLIKKGHEIQLHSLIEIVDVEGFINACHLDDEIIIVGGDGTLNRLANRVYGIDFKQKIYLYQAGTGNDFARSLKIRGRLIQINDYLKNLPQIKFNAEEKYFLNGAGIGLDGYVVSLVNESNRKKNKINYFRHAFLGFKRFKPIGGTLIIDGKEIVEDKIWFVAAMNAPYFGGGMKIAPKADRKEALLDVVVVRKIAKWKLILIFPIIYLGWHTALKKYVQIYKAKNIEIKFKKETYMQIDGDHYYPIQTVNLIAANKEG